MTTSATPSRNGSGKAATLQRETFRTSRLLDFCSEKELTAQAGHERKDWPLVALKELLDNALDSCEEAGTPPQITVTVDKEGITVADNGPGIPESTISAILDFAVRVSSREAYVSPTRGAQGNALKTIMAMPFVLDGERGVVEIESQGKRHVLTFKTDQVRQTPIVDMASERVRLVRNGTSIKVTWPNSASSILTDSEARFLQLASDFTFLNPHLTLAVDWFGPRTVTKATDTAWVKWRPSDPTSPHWYQPEHLERLACAYIAHDRDRGADRTVREFVSEFRGLTGTGKQKIVLEATGLARMNLSELANGDGLQHDLVAKLLGAMKEESTPIKPVMLGVIGAEHFRRRFIDLGVVPETFQYRKQVAEDEAGVPLVVEVAFGWRGEESEEERRLVAGVNWSPGIINPFRTLGGVVYGDGLGEFLGTLHAGSSEPIIVAVHCASPRVRYTDRGKSAAVIPGAEFIAKVVVSATKKWTKRRKAEKRGRSRAARRDALCACRRTTIKAAVARVLPDAYVKVSDGGKLPAQARQLYYAVRGSVLEATGRDALNSAYFSQTLVPQYMAEHAEKTAGWDVVYDARGHFAEPHTRRVLGLGTLEVRAYLREVTAHDPSTVSLFEFLDAGEYPTCGPRNRFSAVLFIEKEGFLPLFERVLLAERYDLAIMSSKGMPVVACRRLADELCGPFGIPLLILHDFDKAGFSMVGTLEGVTRYDQNGNERMSRYEYRHNFDVIDLGLRLPDVRAYELESEPVQYGKRDPRPNLQDNDATDQETAFLCDSHDWRGYTGRRVELNAFTSREFITWIEAKLQRHKIGKVIPDEAVLTAAYRRAAAIAYTCTRLEKITKEATAWADTLKVPKDLSRTIRRRLKANPAQPWDRVVAGVAATDRTAREAAG